MDTGGKSARPADEHKIVVPDAMRLYPWWVFFLVLIGIGFILYVSVSVFAQTYDNLILGKFGTAEILKYLDASDHDKALSEEQIAAKYILGEIPADREPPARAHLEWNSLPASEQRQLKVIWFREHYKELNVEEVNKYVNLDYLKARAAAEFRENPLAIAADR